MASADLRAELECSICLDIYTDPVMLRCGHNFCCACIDGALDTQQGSGRYSCPGCRKKFQYRPALQRNITLRNIVEKFLSAQPHQEASGVFCTHCVDSPVPAVRSCLHCDVSLCDKHLSVHNKSPEHVLCDPTLSMETRKCSVHKKFLEYYCADDDTFVCVTCSLAGEHRGHWMEILSEAAMNKKNKMRNILQKLQIKREKMEKRVQSLQEHQRKVEDKSTGDTETVTAMFRDLQKCLDNLKKIVLSKISGRAERVSHSLLDMIQKLEIKKGELSRKMDDIEKLCNMTDPVTVLQESNTGDLWYTEYEGDEDKDRHDKLLHDLRGLDVARVSHTLHTGVSDIIREINVNLCIQGAEDILLDVNMVGNDLYISDDRRTASRADTKHNRPQTPERFQDPQVISSRSFSSGRYYWDTDAGESDMWRVGMCYPSILRRGGQPVIGWRKKFWGVWFWSNNCCSLMHDRNVFHLPVSISSNKIRIELDFKSDRISFYDLCDPIRHIHTFSTTFTEPGES